MPGRGHHRDQEQQEGCSRVRQRVDQKFDTGGQDDDDEGDGVRPLSIKPAPRAVGCLNLSQRAGFEGEQAKMIAALKAAEAACSEDVCYLISGDLAHIGPKFGDERRAEGPWLEASRKQDATILAELTRADPTSYFETIAAEDNARRICGLPPTYLALETIRPRAGRVLHYQQFIDPAGHESVSFAAAAFYE